MHPSLIDLLKHALLDLKASWVMWILLGLSVIDLIIIVERAAFLRSIRDDVPKLAAQLDALLVVAQGLGITVSKLLHGIEHYRKLPSNTTN